MNASGYVTARRRATVSSKVTGKVLEVFVEEGKAVREGPGARAAGRFADARGARGWPRRNWARRAKALPKTRRGCARPSGTLERREQLVKEKVVGQAEVDTAQAAGRVARGADRARAAAGRGARESQVAGCARSTSTT